MSIKNAKIFFFAALMLLLLSACSSIQNRDQKFLEDIHFSNVIDVNQSLNLKIDTSAPKSWDNIDLSLTNNSDNTFIFPANFNIHLYRYDKGKNQWVAVENPVIYGEQNFILHGKNSGISEDYWIGASPHGLSVVESQILRVVVFGNYVENGMETDKIALAYTEATYPGFKYPVR